VQGIITLPRHESRNLLRRFTPNVAAITGREPPRFDVPYTKWEHHIPQQVLLKVKPVVKVELNCPERKPTHINPERRNVMPITRFSSGRPVSICISVGASRIINSLGLQLSCRWLALRGPPTNQLRKFMEMPTSYCRAERDGWSALPAWGSVCDNIYGGLDVVRPRKRARRLADADGDDPPGKRTDGRSRAVKIL